MRVDLRDQRRLVGAEFAFRVEYIAFSIGYHGIVEKDPGIKDVWTICSLAPRIDMRPIITYYM